MGGVLANRRIRRRIFFEVMSGDAMGRIDPRRLMHAQRLLIAINLLGLPSAAVPVGQAGTVPLGVQVIGSRYREDLCLDAAEVIEAHCGLATPIDPAG